MVTPTQETTVANHILWPALNAVISAALGEGECNLHAPPKQSRQLVCRQMEDVSRNESKVRSLRDLAQEFVQWQSAENGRVPFVQDVQLLLVRIEKLEKQSRLFRVKLFQLYGDRVSRIRHISERELKRRLDKLQATFDTAILVHDERLQNFIYSHSTNIPSNSKRQARLQLVDWFQTHVEHPFPSKQQKLQLCQQTGMTLKQLNKWFINARMKSRSVGMVIKPKSVHMF
jgi:hypothetical protein